MNEFYGILAAIGIMAVEIVLDWYYIRKKKKSDKPQTTIIRAVLAILVGIIIDRAGIADWWRFIVLLIGVYVVFFDYLINILVLKRKLFYVPENPMGWDKVIAGLPFYGVLFFRLWIALSAYYIYIGWVFY